MDTSTPRNNLHSHADYLIIKKNGVHMKINEVMAKYKSRDIKLTYEDYLTLPDDGNKYEILEGEIIMTPAPSIKHQTILRNLFLLIHSYVEEQKMGQVFFAPVDVILSDHTVLEPDLLFVANENRNLIKERGIFGPPDLCAEIISKSNSILRSERQENAFRETWGKGILAGRSIQGNDGHIFCGERWIHFARTTHQG
jgi:hypothetical protein